MSRAADLDDEERAAARILAKLAESGGVEFVSSWGPSTLAAAAARVLSRGVVGPELAAAFCEWLMAQIEVADVYVEDAELEAILAREWSRAAGRVVGVEARNPALEAELLAHPDDRERSLVYADWLQAQGDPFGELIVHQVAAHGPDATPARVRAADDFLADHAQALLGRMAEYLDSAIHLRWSNGFVREARLAREADDHGSYEGPILLAWLLEQRACLLLRALEFESLLAKRSGQLGEMIEVVAAHRPPHVRALTIGQGDEGELSPLFDALPDLRELNLVTARLRPVPLRFPQLRVLSLDLGWSGDAQAMLTRSTLPRLESLTVLGPSDPDLLAQCDFSALRHLRLHTGFEQALALVRSPIVIGLETLDLSGSELDDAVVHDVILPNLGRLRHLRRLDLSDNALGEDAAAAIEAAFGPGVAVIGEQNPVDPEADGDDEYYDDVME